MTGRLRVLQQQSRSTESPVLARKGLRTLQQTADDNNFNKDSPRLTRTLIRHESLQNENVDDDDLLKKPLPTESSKRTAKSVGARLNVINKTKSLDNNKVLRNKIRTDKTIKVAKKNGSKSKSVQKAKPLVDAEQPKSVEDVQIEKSRVIGWLTSETEITDPEYWRLMAVEQFNQKCLSEKRLENERILWETQMEELKLENELLREENRQLRGLVNQAMKLKMALHRLGIDNDVE